MYCIHIHVCIYRYKCVFVGMFVGCGKLLYGKAKTVQLCIPLCTIPSPGVLTLAPLHIPSDVASLEPKKQKLKS